jgi:hypothetical protein
MPTRRVWRSGVLRVANAVVVIEDDPIEDYADAIAVVVTEDDPIEVADEVSVWAVDPRHPAIIAVMAQFPLVNPLDRILQVLWLLSQYEEPLVSHEHLEGPWLRMGMVLEHLPGLDEEALLEGVDNYVSLGVVHHVAAFGVVSSHRDYVLFNMVGIW